MWLSVKPAPRQEVRLLSDTQVSSVVLTKYKKGHTAMRAHEFIEPEEQLRLLTKIGNDTRAKLEREHQAQRQLGSAGDLPFDFFKKILDVAWDEISHWIVQSNTDRVTGTGSIAPSSSVSPKTVVPPPSVNKAAVTGTKASKVTKPKQVKTTTKKQKPKRVKVPPPPKPVPQPVKRVTPVNPNPGQPLARIKPYGTMGLMK